MKRRLAAIVMTSILGISLLAGCGGSSGASSGSADNAAAKEETEAEAETEEAETEPAAEAAAEGGEYHIGVIVKLTDGHFKKVMAGAQAFADEHDDVTIDIQSPSGATAFDEQANMIETCLSGQYDAVVISPLQSTTTTTLVSGSDKVIVALDTDFEAPEKSTFVGTGNKDAAKSGGVAAIEAAKAAGIETPKVAILTGVQGDETHEARLAGYKEAVEENGGELVEVQYCDAIADRAVAATEGIIQKYPDGIDIILSTNDDMAMGAVKSVQDSGSAAFANTIICGFDGNTLAIKAVQDGSLGIDVAQLGYDMGYKAVEAAYKVLKGEQVESYIDSGAKVVDSSNAQEYIDDMTAKGLWEE